MITALWPDMSAAQADALALSILSALCGAVALAGAARLFANIDDRFGARGVSPLWPTLMLAASPLFWISGLRPLSDMVGFAAVLWTQAVLLEKDERGRSLVLGALLAGLGGGIRLQTLALTAPALLLAVVAERRPDGRRAAVAGVAGLLGILVWAVPLVVVSGGVAAYVAALGAQAGEDFAFVTMLWSDLTVRHAVQAMYETTVLPWSAFALAVAVGGAGVLGAAVAFTRAPRALGAMLLMFLPYAVYHLLFQETVTVRYAMPLLPLVAWCVTRVVDVRPVGAVAARSPSATRNTSQSRASPAARRIARSRARARR